MDTSLSTVEHSREQQFCLFAIIPIHHWYQTKTIKLLIVIRWESGNQIPVMSAGHPIIQVVIQSVFISIAYRIKFVFVQD